jgi:hypothetical protein
VCGIVREEAFWEAVICKTRETGGGGVTKVDLKGTDCPRMGDGWNKFRAVGSTCTANNFRFRSHILVP